MRAQRFYTGRYILVLDIDYVGNVPLLKLLRGTNVYPVHRTVGSWYMWRVAETKPPN